MTRRGGYYRGKHPRDLGPTHVRDFLTHLARDGRVAASTQNQALAALLFLYGSVLEMPIAAPFDHCTPSVRYGCRWC